MQKIFNREQWPVAGSTLYYALLHCDDSAVERAQATLELVKTLSTVLELVSDPAVAEQKVHWWHEEIARLANGEARHPACQSFQSLVLQAGAAHRTHSAITAKRWLMVLSCNSNERFANAANEDEFHERIHDDYRARLELLADAVNGDTRSMDNTLLSKHLVIGLGLSERLRRFHALHSSAAMVWPDSYYQNHQLQAESINDDANTGARVALLRQVTDNAAEQLDAGIDAFWQSLNASLQAGSDAAQQSNAAQQGTNADIAIVTAATLRLAQLRRWQKQQVDLLREYRGLTPFQKSLAMWRTKRKFAKFYRQASR